MFTTRQPASRVRRATRPAAVAAGLGLLAAPLTLLATGPAADAATVQVTVLDFNDFHGRIDSNTTKFATTIEQARAAAGEANTLVLSGGDNIGASLFASAYNDDKPTIDVLNALDTHVSVVGNHEFDKGWPWFKSHVVEGSGTAPDGTAYPKAQFPYLGANVVDSSGNAVLPASAQFTVGGANVCVIGAVTQETPSLVSPGGISGLTFTDPVAAVNKEVQRLASTGVDCDATIADYHEGAPKSEPVTQAEQEAASAVFKHLTQDTDSAVDVIYNGHTHQTYAYQGARPVIQAGNYGEKVGQLTMAVDTAANTVSGVNAQMLPRAAAADTSLPRVAEVKQIVDAAIAASNEIGNQPVGSITADIARANLTGSYGADGWSGTGEDRGAESAVGDLVANALRDGLPSDQGTADLGIVNPGGLRADLKYAGDTSTNPANTDGVVTFAEANAVLPFVNNIWTVKVSGATLKEILEQQWQPEGASRPYLHLGLSDNVRVTRDPSRAAGDRITSIRINHVKVRAGATYTVSTFSFLGQGGDNFTAFTDGVAKDTGLIDRDLWIKYLKNHASLSPDFARQQVDEQGMPGRVDAGQAYSFSVSTLDIKSAGAPANSTINVFALRRGKRVDLGEFPVTDGTATPSFTVPSDVADNLPLQIRVQPSGTLVGDLRLAPKMSYARKPLKVVVRKTRATVTVRLTAPRQVVTGEVRVRTAGRTYTRWLRDGKATFTLRRYATTGRKSVTVRYYGSRHHTPTTVKKYIRVTR